MAKKKTPDVLYESLAAVRRAERDIATRSDMPGNIEDYKLAFTEFYVCHFDGELITDPAHMYMSPDGRKYHNTDCASSLSQIDNFYETLDDLSPCCGEPITEDGRCSRCHEGVR